MRGTTSIGLLITLSCLALVQAELKTTQVQVLFRHGDRTPQKKELYPNDINDVSVYEPWGLGQLINRGKMREFQIGQILKTRYQNLLGNVYIPSAVYAFSTDFDRTKMSLQLVLAGLYPPSETEMWNSELRWMPIPTHYAPIPLDVLMHSHNCPEFKEAVDRVMQIPEVKAKLEAHQDLFEFVSVKSGLNITEPPQLYDLYNNIVGQKAMNLTISEWLTDAVFRQMEELVILQYEIWSYTKEAKTYNGGAIVRRFIENMHLNKTEENSRKMYLYSAHERTVSSYLKAQNITEPKIPHYGTAVMFEKLVDDDGKQFVRLLMWTGVTEQLITLQVPGCEEVCPIETYLKLTSDVIPSDEQLNCLWNSLSVEELRKVFDERISD